MSDSNHLSPAGPLTRAQSSSSQDEEVARIVPERKAVLVARQEANAG